jgi:hypothetical protein
MTMNTEGCRHNESWGKFLHSKCLKVGGEGKRELKASRHLHVRKVRQEEKIRRGAEMKALGNYDTDLRHSSFRATVYDKQLLKGVNHIGSWKKLRFGTGKEGTFPHKQEGKHYEIWRCPPSHFNFIPGTEVDSFSQVSFSTSGLVVSSPRIA